jgi:hypothetical protein
MPKGALRLPLMIPRCSTSHIYYGWHNHASPAPAVASAASDIVPAGIRPVEPVEEFAI